MSALKHLPELSDVMGSRNDQTDRVDRARLVESGGAREDSPSWNLNRAKQGDTIRVDGTVSRARGREGVREWVLQSATSTRPSRKRERGRTEDQDIIDELQVSSKTTDKCVEPTISQSIVVKRKLSQSEVDRMVQEAEKSRDEDEVNESKNEAESGLEKFRVLV